MSATLNPFILGTQIRQAPDPARRPALSGLLRLPVFYKALIANILLMLAGAAAVAWLPAAFAASWADAGTLGAVMVVLGLLPVVIVNALVLRLALRPMATLEQAAERVAHGDPAARADLSPLADREQRRLIEVFNAMLDTAAHDRARLQELATRAGNAAEAERTRIARELHDDIAQSLAALLVQLRIARKAADANRRDQQLEQVAADLARVMAEVGRIAWNLRPPALELLGLAPALEQHARQMCDVHGLTCRTRLGSVRGALAPHAELAVYRIAQEAISNIARHAEAESIQLELRQGPRHVTLIVQDDGKGFDPARQDPGQTGLGLLGMTERAANLQGTLRIDSVPGAGSRITAEIPREVTNV